MSVFRVTRTESYLEHKSDAGVKQKTGADGKRFWTEYGKAWRRQVYSELKDEKRMKAWNKDASNLNKGVSDAGNAIDQIIQGRKYDKQRDAIRKKASRMTDEQLRSITNRINLEKNYADAVMSKDAKQGKITFGKVMGIVGGVTVAVGAGLTIAEKVYSIYDRVNKTVGT